MRKKIGFGLKILSFFIAVSFMLTLVPQNENVAFAADGSPTVISAGNQHTFVIKNDNTLWGWGGNKYYQIGDGTTTDVYVPKQILDDVKTVSSGSTHTLAVTNDGTAWVWGYGQYGEIGELLSAYNYYKKKPTKLGTNISTVSAGWDHSLVLSKSGTLYGMGFNYYGALGDGTSKNKYTPVKITTEVTDISAGNNTSFAIKSDGTLWAWGRNNYGQLGDGTTKSRIVPIKIMNDVKAVSAGSYHTLAIKTDGSLWAWGRNADGQLGDGTTKDRLRPKEIMAGVASISAGGYHSLALKTDGTLLAWGSNGWGQLGNKSTENKSSMSVEIGTDVAYISAGTYYSMAIKKNGTVWGWGKNDVNQTGNGTVTSYNGPMKVVGEEGIDQFSISASSSSSTTVPTQAPASTQVPVTTRAPVATQAPVATPKPTPKPTPAQGANILNLNNVLAGGDDHSLGITDDGKLFSWGANYIEEAYDDGLSYDSSYKPTAVPILAGAGKVSSVAAGSFHSLILMDNGSVYAFGFNNRGQLGDGTTQSRNEPKKVSLPENAGKAVAIAASGWNSMALMENGAVYTWGANQYGQIGDGTTVSRTMPKRVPLDSRAVAIALGENHSLAVMEDGTMYAWGLNDCGQLGIGTKVNQSRPRKVLLPKGVRAITTDGGWYHSIALMSDGSIYSFGRNAGGELGDGTTVERLEPVRVSITSDMGKAVAISAGNVHSLVLMDNGAVYACGFNWRGWLGDGTTEIRTTLTRVKFPSSAKTVVSIAAGGDHNLAKTSDGVVYTWGDNTSGKLGDGTHINRYTPTKINFP